MLASAASIAPQGVEESVSTSLGWIASSHHQAEVAMSSLLRIFSASFNDATSASRALVRSSKVIPWSMHCGTSFLWYRSAASNSSWLDFMSAMSSCNLDSAAALSALFISVFLSLTALLFLDSVMNCSYVLWLSVSAAFVSASKVAKSDWMTSSSARTPYSFSSCWPVSCSPNVCMPSLCPLSTVPLKSGLARAFHSSVPIFTPDFSPHCLGLGACRSAVAVSAFL
mmetsp:Transcript_80250/g.236032  ORF Transcript_80250/g.236032 Transcript_80250/m.236032 type:complete len:226 (-) Transcript_80250:874-1551(-)